MNLLNPQSFLTDVHEELLQASSDVEALIEVAAYLNAMRGNDVPRDLFIRITGSSEIGPLGVTAYAHAAAVKDCHAEAGWREVDDVRLARQVM
jgi:hypothetical protein